jgi:transposase
MADVDAVKTSKTALRSNNSASEISPEAHPHAAFQIGPQRPQVIAGGLRQTGVAGQFRMRPVPPGRSRTRPHRLPRPLKERHQSAPAYDPAVLVKIILLAYSRGIISIRRIEAACREYVLFIAVSGDSQPNFTTLAAFVSELGELTAKLFAQVLTVCDRQGLIGREMFAIDGVKLSSNASKAKSGTGADYQRQAMKMEKAAKVMWTSMATPMPPRSANPRPNAKRARWNGCNAKPNNCATGSRTTRRIAKDRRAVCACPIAPTTNPPRWPPARA